MAYDNNQNNRNENRVNTVGLNLFDDNSMLLRLSYLDDSLSIQICEPEQGSDGKRHYPEQKRHSVIITADRAAALYNDVIIPSVKAVEENVAFARGIFCNRMKTTILQIMVKDNEVYLSILAGIDENKVSQDKVSFKFQKVQYIDDYNPSTGEVGNQTDVHGGYLLFTKFIELGVEALTGSAGHSMRKSNRATTRMIFNYLKAIGEKVGIIDPQQRSYNPAATSGFNRVNTESMNDTVPFPDATEKSSSMADILN